LEVAVRRRMLSGVEDQRTRGEEENEVAIDGDDWMERGRVAEEEAVVEQ
jgi:hypothetical protein